MIAPLIIGLLFGVFLQRAGLARHARITDVFLLRDLAVMKFLASGLVVGSVVLEGSHALGLVAAVPVVPTYLVAQAVGGALFGVGMAVAGFCPGTIAAAAGTGRLDALGPGLLGLCAGALVFERLAAVLPDWLTAGKLTTSIPALAGVSPWLVILLLVELAVLGLYGRDRA